MTTDYYKLRQVTALVVAAMLYAVLLLKLTNKASSHGIQTWVLRMRFKKKFDHKRSGKSCIFVEWTTPFTYGFPPGLY